ncbi:MAG: DUF4340 domain-containing protein [Clostridia bacterium]|nr:DUF4340 domain-containing protein [Clostridia bacterium]
MTKKGKTLIAAAALAAVLTAGWIAARYFGDREEEGQPPAGEEILFAEESDLLLSLGIGSGEETLTFSRDNGDLSWTVEEYPGAAADEGKIGRILDAVSPLKAIRRLEGEAEDAGLGDGALRLMIGTEDGEKIFWIGNENRALGGVYLRIEGEDAVFLVPRELSDAIRHPAAYFLKPDPIPRLLSPEEIRVNGLSLVYREKGSDKVWSGEFRWFFEGSDDRYAGTDEVEALLNAVRKSAFREVAGRRDDPALLLRSGLSAPEAVFGADWTEDGEKKTFTLLIGKSFPGEDGETLCYAAVEGSENISVLDGSVREALLAANEKTLYPHAALPVDWASVERAEVAFGGERHAIGIARENREDENGEMRESLVFREGERELDGEAAEAFFDALSALTAEREAEDGAGSEKPVLSITLYRDAESFREMTFELLPYDPLFLRVRFDGRDFLLVGKSEGEKLLSLLDELFGLS